MKKYIAISIISFISVIILIFSYINGAFDIVKREAVNSLNDLLISGLEKTKVEDAWVISLPDKSSKISLQANDKTAMVTLTLDIRPFLKAGMDVNKVPSFMEYDLNKNELYVTSIYENNGDVKDSVAIDAIYENIVTLNRSRLSYHHTLDHFGLSLDNGNAFEYAKDIKSNDKDIVIVLNPEILEETGVNVSKVEDYTYTDVPMDNGEQAKKLLKIFNVEEVTKCLITNTGC